MADTTDLTNFLDDVATAIKSKTGDNTPIPAGQFDTKIRSIPVSSGVFQQKNFTANTNGNYIIEPDTGYDAIDRLSLAVSVNPSSQPYTPLDYIEATGTQYIDTNYYPNQDTKIEAVVKSTNIEENGYFQLGGTRTDSSPSVAFQIGGMSTDNKLNIRYGTVENLNTFTLANNYINTKCTYSFENGSYTISNDDHSESFTFTAVSDFQCDYSMYIGSINIGNNPNWVKAYKLYSYKIWEDDVLVRDFIPAKLKDGNIGLWDKVENKFYGNDAYRHYSFLEPLPNGYQELYYIKTTGTQWLNPNLTWHSSTKLQFTMKCTEGLAWQGIYGVNASNMAHCCSYDSSTSQWRYYANNSYQTVNFSASSFTKVRFAYGEGIALNNNEALTTAWVGQYTGTPALYLMRITDHYSKIYFRDIQIYQKGKLVRNLIPAKRIQDNAIGMYDMVTDTFFGNAGSGSFTAGDEI